MNGFELNYTPPGPVAAAFHESDAFVRILLGPVGSGKSATCCIELFNRALQQKPSKDGVRRSRFCAIRNTYAELKSTTIKTYQDWFAGIETTRWDTPIVSTISLPDLGDGTSLHMEVLFIALDRPEDSGKLRSLELGIAWLNEASLLDKAVLDIATQRVGRYPSKFLHGGPTFSGVICDSNMPDDDGWLYKIAEEEKPEGFAVFKQPGGIYKVLDKRSPDFGTFKPNKDAENIPNLPDGFGYYLRQVAGKSDDYIQVFLEARYGSTMHGRPVYPEFVDKIHVSDKPLRPIPGMPLVIAFDFGLTPACCITQMTPKGQVLVLDEVVCENMGIRSAYLDAVLPLINSKYGGYRIEAWGDPAGIARSSTDEKSCFMELEELGLICEPTHTNKFLPRKDAVAFFLQRMTSSGPGMLIDPSCKTVIKGFRGGYMYERLQVSGETRFKDRPCKNRFSHPHDALQYACLALRGDSQPAAVAQPVKKIAWA